MECASCGTANRSGARFCDACGNPLIGGGTPTLADTEARRIVTLVFADLIGSTTLHERIDAESARRVMDRYYSALRTVIEAHGGTVIKLLGDGVLAGFGLTRAREDDARRAVQASMALHGAMAELTKDLGPLATELGLRVGVNTGEVVVGARDADVVGDPVNVAARLQNEAAPGSVLIGDDTRRLVERLVTVEWSGNFQLKGRAEPVAGYRVVSLEPPADSTTFVGRDDELERIMGHFRSAVDDRCAHLVTVIGAPGLGKTRLLDEAMRRLTREATVLRARCDASNTLTFAPVADAISAFVSTPRAEGVEAVVPSNWPERERLVGAVTALCAGDPGVPEETFWTVRRFLAALGHDQPVVLVLDDLQWARPLLLDLTEHLVEWSTDDALLVLGAARPELRDAPSSLTEGRSPVSEVITLEGLDAVAASRVAADAIGADQLPAGIARRILAVSEGNPLFVGALVRKLVDDGALEWDGERWKAATDLAHIAMPLTIQALLASRIDRLSHVERLVLERAAVIGPVFSRSAVSHLLPQEMRVDLEACLESLHRAELVDVDGSRFVGEPGVRFHHALIRDAAYRRTLKDSRADLHAELASWLESGEPAGESERDDVVGWHLERACHLRLELGLAGARTRELGDRASVRLGRAGRSALARDDVRVAAALFARAVKLRADDDLERAELALDWCEALLADGDVAATPSALAEIARFSASSPRLTAWHACFAGQLAVLTEPLALPQTVERVATAAAQLSTLGDDAGEAKADAVLGSALARLGRVGECELTLDRALIAARRAGDRRRANAVLAGAPVAALWGPSPVTRASGRCLDVVRVLRVTAGAPVVEAVALRCQAVLEALRGRPEAARRMIASSRRLVEELGSSARILEADAAAGLIELVNGDAAAADELLRPTYEGFRSAGLEVDAAQAGALLARAWLAMGRVADAEALSYECEDLAGHDLKAAIAWRGVRAGAFARRGLHAEAVALAREAVSIAADTDALLDRADAHVALSIALGAAGDDLGAYHQFALARELWTTKGATALVGTPEARRRATAEPDHAPTSVGSASNVVTRLLLDLEEAFRRADWTRFEALASAALVFDDRRSLRHVEGDLAWWVESSRLLAEAGAVEDATHLAILGDHLVLDQICWRNGRGESPFEVEALRVSEADADGRLAAVVIFDLDQRSEADAELHRRFDERSASHGAMRRSPPPNRASHAMGRWCDAIVAHDEDTLREILDEDVELDDRRRVVDGNGDRPTLLNASRSLDEGTTLQRTVLSTLGEHIGLDAARWVGRSTGAASVIDVLHVYEVDDAGRIVAVALFDAADRQAAYDELIDRFARSPDGRQVPGALFDALRSANRGDIDGFRACLAPSYRYVDHHALGAGVMDRDEHVEYMRVLTLTASDYVYETTHYLRWSETGAVASGRLHGHTDEDSEFVQDFLRVAVADDEGIVALEIFPIDAVDAALARFDALTNGRGSLTTASATVTQTMERWRAAVRVSDLDAIDQMLGSAFVYDDRRALTRTLGDRAMYLSSVAAGFETQLNIDAEVVSAVGGHVTLEWVRWSGATAGGEFEGENLSVIESDGTGCLVAMVVFDVDDRLAAHDELWRRFRETEDGSVLPSVVFDIVHAYNHRDVERFRTYLAPEFELVDHRPIGAGHMGPDEYAAFLAALLESTVESRFESVRSVRLDPRGSIDVARLTGTTVDGAPFELDALQVAVVRDGKLAHWEMFPLDGVDAAQARFEQLIAQ
jgi:class 3 adenylate cyclase